MNCCSVDLPASLSPTTICAPGANRNCRSTSLPNPRTFASRSRIVTSPELRAPGQRVEPAVEGAPDHVALGLGSRLEPRRQRAHELAAERPFLRQRPQVVFR